MKFYMTGVIETLNRMICSSILLLAGVFGGVLATILMRIFSHMSTLEWSYPVSYRYGFDFLNVMKINEYHKYQKCIFIWHNDHTKLFYHCFIIIIIVYGFLLLLYVGELCIL